MPRVEPQISVDDVKHLLKDPRDTQVSSKAHNPYDPFPFPFPSPFPS
jgi:hypothetical protein